jgi:hypothetical protein
MSDSLDSWLPKDPLEFTRVFEPVVIDDAIAQLESYHPLKPEETPRNFRLVRIEGTALATVRVASENWAPEFEAILGRLKLRVVNEGQFDEHLLDDAVPGEEFPMSGWKVVSWTIKRTGFNGHLDPPEPTRLTDRIVWQRLDDPAVTAVSSYTWLPYKK